MNTIRKLEILLPKVLSPDRYFFSRELRNLKKLERQDKKKPADNQENKFQKKLAGLEKRMNASFKKRELRFRNRPSVTIDQSLPVYSRCDEIINAIKSHNVVIISGQTGSGKTTQIPKMCIMAGRGVNGLIGCTQPRRIAAVSTATRIAEELGEDVGKSVGYKIRFEDKSGDNPYIKIMTDGVLLAETQNDPFLNNYDTIIVDEAHERTVNIDIILGIVKRLLNKRKDLKLIITSATIDTEKFSKVFNNAPVIEVSGRMFPVEVRYMPNEDEEKGYVEHAAEAALSLFRESMSGDILIFMPTEQDIRDTSEILEKRSKDAFIVLPLFARMPVFQQRQIFNRTQKRKIIVATNIAETSLTIPNIRYVVDTGLARIKEYSPSNGIVSLPVKGISQSSADQRAGRCGRVSEGVCVRLFEENDYNQRDRFSKPEIYRTSLAEVILKMISLKINDADDFPFVDRPRQQAIIDGFNTLSELGAIEKDHNGNYILTANGVLMSKLPMEPRLSRILIEANQRKCLREALIIVSMLSVQDPRERPIGKEDAADEAHKTFSNYTSDFLTLLNIWNRYQHELKENRSQSKIRKYCRENYLSFNRMKEVSEIYAQITQMLEDQGIVLKKGKPAFVVKEFGKLYNNIHQSILTGFLINIACRKQNNTYSATRQREVVIFPGSGIFNKSREWIVCASIVQTSNLYARTAANIDVTWLEEAGKNQCEYSYRDPYWDGERGEVVAFESASLYGLEIIRNRRKVYGAISPAEATKVFIHDALVKDIYTLSAVESTDIASGNSDLFQISRSYAFMEHDASVVKRISVMESRIRKKIMIADSLSNFFAEKLRNVYNTRTLDEYIKENKGDDLLRIEADELASAFPGASELDDYPERIVISGKEIRLNYCFDPESPNDGITALIPVDLIMSVDLQSLELKIPGFVRDKITALIKAVPGQYRKHLSPVSEAISLAIENVYESDSTVQDFLKDYLYKKYKIPAQVIDDIELPRHLALRFGVTDAKGNIIISDREPGKLISEIREKYGKEVFRGFAAKWERRNISSWDFGDLPETVPAKHGNGMEFAFYPGLCASSDSLSLKLFTDKMKALASHREGVAALIRKQISSNTELIKNRINIPDELKKACTLIGGQSLIKNSWQNRVSEFLLMKDIRTKKNFDEYALNIESVLLKDAGEFNLLINEILISYENTLGVISKLEKQSIAITKIGDFLKKIRNELSMLLCDDFITGSSNVELEALPKYVKALSIRAERGCANISKDQQKEIDVLEFVNVIDKEFGLTKGMSDKKKKAIRELRRLVEEYKISVFAPEIKTNARVSAKILREMIEDIRGME